jgi:hypothetical protein
MRQDSLVPTAEWAKHLRPFGKRRQAKAERQAAKTLIDADDAIEPRNSKKVSKKWGIQFSRNAGFFGLMEYKKWFPTERSRDDAFRRWEETAKDGDFARKIKR